MTPSSSYANGLKYLENGYSVLSGLCDKNPGSNSNKKCCKEEARSIINSLKQAWTLNYGFGPDMAGRDPVGGHFCWDWANIFNEAVSGLPLRYWSNEKGFAVKGNTSSVHWFIKLYAYKNNDPMYRANVDDGFFTGNQMVFQGEFPDSFGGSYKEKPLPTHGANPGRNQPLNPFISNKW